MTWGGCYRANYWSRQLPCLGMVGILLDELGETISSLSDMLLFQRVLDKPLQDDLVTYQLHHWT